MITEFLPEGGYTLSSVLIIHPGQLISEVSAMRIKCPKCQEKATVYSRANTADDINSVYARCNNPACEKFDHSFVSHVTFSHFIDPKSASLQMTFELLFDQLPQPDRDELLARMATR